MYNIRKIVIAIICLLTSGFALAQKQPKEPFVDPKWTQECEPFRVAGNVYYVGTYDLGCYLITTPKGHILINTGVAASMPMLRSHIEKLGFKLSDIKILLVSQVHYDHVGTMAEMKKITGAKLMVQQADAQVMADGGASDYLYSELAPLFAPVKPDRILQNNDVVELGGVKLTVLHHPGHTKGSCSYALTVKDGPKQYKVLIANMPSVIIEDKISEVHTYPGMEKDYTYTFAAMKALKFDLWVAAHASQFGLHNKRRPGDSYNPEAFRDQQGYLDKLSELEKHFREMK